MNQKPQTTEDLAKAVRGALEALRKRRPIFRSESDLCDEFGRELTCQGIQGVQAEKFFQDNVIGRIRVDLAAVGFVAELKYCAKVEESVNSEEFKVSTSKPSIPFRFWEDVKRVEHCVKQGNRRFGCVICVANQPLWDGEGSGPSRVLARRFLDERWENFSPPPEMGGNSYA